MPKVSVIIPVYNTAPWLNECLNSVINQTFQDLEIICIDDGSSDESPSILKEYAKRDNRVHIVLTDQNYGQSHARNLGIQMMQGRYVYFLDSDDSITLEAIEQMYETCCEKDLDILYFDAEAIFESDEYKEKYGRRYLYHRDENHYSNDIYAGSELMNLFMENDEWTCSMPRQFIRADLIRGNGFRFQEGRIHEDELFAFECAINAKRVAYTSLRLFRRRFRNQSTMTREKSAENFIGYFSAVWSMSQITRTRKLYSVPVRSYLARMNNQCISLYDQFKDHIEEKIAYLNDQELQGAYYYFETLMDRRFAYGEISDNLINLLGKYEKIYLYGAGAVAQSVYAALVKRGFTISGFVVTNKEENQQALLGHRVMDVETFEKICDAKDSIVVISIKYDVNEIEYRLTKNGIKNVGYQYKG